MVDPERLDEILKTIAELPNVLGSVAFSCDGSVIASEIKDQDLSQIENIALWALGVFMSSEMVARKMPPDFSQLKQVTVVSTEGLQCISWTSNGDYLLCTMTDTIDVWEIPILTEKISSLLNTSRSIENNMNFEPH